MRGSAARFLRLGASLSGLVVLGWVMTVNGANPPKGGIPLPTDWTHSHVIFSQPANADEARIVGEDPRYWQQLHHREESLALINDPARSGFQLQDAANQINGDWSQNLGTGASPGAGNYPAKFSFSTTVAKCGSDPTPDYVVYSTGLLGSGSQASIAAFDNVYNGCSGTVPSVYWAYNTGGLILTSPVLSLDGTQVAFVQTSGSPTGQAGLVVLKWKASATETVTLPGVPTLVSNALYRACVAPCMTEVLLHDKNGVAVDDRTSSPFYDYTNDVAWVGGANGWLHKLTGVFKGSPAEISGSGFPAQMAVTTFISSPVYDRISRNLFVGDAGGFLYRVSSINGAVTKSAKLDFGTGVIGTPVLDVTRARVYAFISSDGTTACAGGVACAAVRSLSTTFPSGSSGSRGRVGISVASGSTPNPLYFGTFDSAYYSSASATGSLYVCGSTGGTPTLYRVAVTAGIPANGVAGPVLSTSTTPCSPVTGIRNPNVAGGATELIFASTNVNGTSANPVPCAPNGCIFNFKDTPWQISHSYSLGQEVLDTHFQIQVVSVAGTSGATAPVWSTTKGVPTTDGTVTWLNQGVLSASTAAWKPSTGYAKGTEIWDSNGNVELETRAGTPISGKTTPAWNPTVGATLNEGGTGPRWQNLGPIATHGLTSAGEWRYHRQHRHRNYRRLSDILWHPQRSGMWHIRYRRLRSAGVPSEATIGKVLL
jgi:hypothetical protein